MGDGLDKLINSYETGSSEPTVVARPGTGDQTNPPTDLDALISKYNSSPFSPLTMYGEDAVQASPEALDPFVSEGVKEVFSGQGAITGGALGKAAAETLIRATPIGKLPFIPKAMRTIGTMLGITGGNIAGEEAGELASEALTKGAEGVKGFKPGSSLMDKGIVEHAVEGVTTVTFDKLFNSVFGDLKQSSKRLQNEAAENFAAMLGIDPGNKAAKQVVFDRTALQTIPRITDDLIGVTKDNLFKQAGRDPRKVESQIHQRMINLGEQIDPALEKAGAQIAQQGDTIYNAVSNKLMDVRRWVDANYKDEALRQKAYKLLDEADASLVLRGGEGDLTLQSLNVLKQNYYSDKAIYGTGTLTEDKVSNAVTQQIARTFKETVEQLYDATPFGKNNPSIKSINELYGNYATVAKAIENPLSRLRFEKSLSLGAASNIATGAGAIGYMASGNAGMGAVAAGLALGSQAPKTAAARYAKGQMGMAAAESLDLLAKMGEKVPGATKLGKLASDIMPAAAGQFYGELLNQKVTPFAKKAANQLGATNAFAQNSLFSRNVQDYMSNPQLLEGLRETIGETDVLKAAIKQYERGDTEGLGNSLSLIAAENDDLFDKSPYPSMVIQNDKPTITDKYDREAYRQYIKANITDPKERFDILQALNTRGEMVVQPFTPPEKPIKALPSKTRPTSTVDRVSKVLKKADVVELDDGTERVDYDH